jgi:hypothetical protein
LGWLSTCLFIMLCIFYNILVFTKCICIIWTVCNGRCTYWWKTHW